jgi:hypothetical protein
VAFIVSVSALYCNRCGYCCNSDSIVVGAFGVIVTLLVGWDIYKMIDLNKKIENSLNGQDAKIENIKTQLDNKTQEIERRIEAKTAELEKRVDEQINIRSHEVDYINTFRLMNVLSQENPYDMKVKCLTFCLSDMNKLDRVKNSTILEEVRKAHEDNVFNNASINILKTFISELSKALNNDSVLLNDITSIYNKKTNNPTQNIPATPPAPTGE